MPTPRRVGTAMPRSAAGARRPSWSSPCSPSSWRRSGRRRRHQPQRLGGRGRGRWLHRRGRAADQRRPGAVRGPGGLRRRVRQVGGGPLRRAVHDDDGDRATPRSSPRRWAGRSTATPTTPPRRGCRTRHCGVRCSPATPASPPSCPRTTPSSPRAPSCSRRPDRWPRRSAGRRRSRRGSSQCPGRRPRRVVEVKHPEWGRVRLEPSPHLDRGAGPTVAVYRDLAVGRRRPTTCAAARHGPQRGGRRDG